ncbi:hypothetical protein Tco_0791867 [Tanacetum coccineum]
MEKEEIEKMVEGKENEESYASEFANYMLNNDNDDTCTRIEPESHKENPEVVVVDDDDDVNVTKKKDDKKDDDDEEKDDDVEKKDDDDKNEKEKKDEKKNDVEDKDNVDHTNHALVGTHATGSLESRNEQMQTPIPTPNRSPRKYLSSNKINYEELTATASPTTAITSKSKSKRGFTSNTTEILPGSIAGMCKRRGQIRTHIKIKFVIHEFFMGDIREVLDHCNSVVPELTFAKTNEMIKEEMLRLVDLAVKKD